jgi:uncharacterized protein YqhQ
MKLKLQGGSAIEGGVMLMSKDHYAIAKYPDLDLLEKTRLKLYGEVPEGKRELELTYGNVKKTGWEWAQYTPIIGTIIMLIRSMFVQDNREPWKTVKGKVDLSFSQKVKGTILMGIMMAVLAALSYLVGLIFISIFSVPSGTFLYGFLSSMSLSIISVVIIIGYAYYTSSDILNFHGAEHKVGNVLCKGLEINEENVYKQSKIHVNCSTNLFVNSCIVYPFTIGLLCMWTGNIVIAFVLGTICQYIIGMELFRISTWVGNSFLAYVFNFFGILVQKITTREPEEKHLRAAILAAQTLMKLKRGELKVE